MKALAAIQKQGGRAALTIGLRTLSLSRLTEHARAALANLPTTVLIEVELQGDEVTAIGDVKPHPRVVALRAVKDLRPQDALEAIRSLGGLAEQDFEVRVAEIRALIQARCPDDAVQAFAALSGEASLDRATLEAAMDALSFDAQAVKQASAPFITHFERLRGDGPVVCAALRLVDVSLWPKDVLVQAIDELLAERPLFSGTLDELQPWLFALEKLAPDEATAATKRVEEARRRLAASEERQRKKVLGSKPDFDAVEALFGVKLPTATRRAWELAYEGDYRLGFILAHKDNLEELTKLAQRLSKDLPPELAREGHQLLPFGDAEDDRYFALDLTREVGLDFPVLIICKGSDGDSWEGYPTSEAWLAADGRLKF